MSFSALVFTEGRLPLGSRVAASPGSPLRIRLTNCLPLEEARCLWSRPWRWRLCHVQRPVFNTPARTASQGQTERWHTIISRGNRRLGFEARRAERSGPMPQLCARLHASFCSERSAPAEAAEEEAVAASGSRCLLRPPRRHRRLLRPVQVQVQVQVRAQGRAPSLASAWRARRA